MKNLGIGTAVTTPATTLHLDSTGTPTTIQIDSDTESSIDFNDHGGSAKRYKIGTNISDNNGQFEIKKAEHKFSQYKISLLTFTNWDIRSFIVTCINLTRSANRISIFSHFFPLCNPSW